MERHKELVNNLRNYGGDPYRAQQLVEATICNLWTVCDQSAEKALGRIGWVTEALHDPRMKDGWLGMQHYLREHQPPEQRKPQKEDQATEPEDRD
jgi:hypothetical protein